MDGNKLAGFVEVDPRNIDDVKRTIAECAVAYIGFNVPQYLMDSGPPNLWDVSSSGDQNIAGGHAIILAGYAEYGFRAISWGQYFDMTQAFFAKYVDEVYALADSSWMKITGQTPAGMTLAQLETAMAALKEP